MTQYTTDPFKIVCVQSEPDDEYAEPAKIKNAVFWWCNNVKDESAIYVLQQCQAGNAPKAPVPKYNGEIRSAQYIANAVHHLLDWLRCVEKRKWDNRNLPSGKHMVFACLKGYAVNDFSKLHYNEDPERP